MLNLGVVGCGRVTSMFHLKAINQVPRVNIHAVSDIDIARMNQLQQSCGAPKAYGSFSMMLSDECVDAVAINTPPRFHEEMVLESLGKRKHVLCEKPLSTTVSGCQRIKEKSIETGVTVLPAHNYSHTPCLGMMERMVSEGIIGEVTGMKVSFENNLKQYKSVTNFRVTKQNGLVEDVLPHILSVVHPLLGYCTGIKDVDWSCKSFDVCDNLEATLETSSNVDVDCTMSWTKIVPVFEVKLTGDEGYLKGEFGLRPYSVEHESCYGTKTIDEKGLSWVLDLVQFKHPSFKNQYEHFADLVLNGGTPRISIDDEINIIETVSDLSTYLEE